MGAKDSRPRSEEEQKIVIHGLSRVFGALIRTIKHSHLSNRSVLKSMLNSCYRQNKQCIIKIKFNFSDDLESEVSSPSPRSLKRNTEGSPDFKSYISNPATDFQKLEKLMNQHTENRLNKIDDFDLKSELAKAAKEQRRETDQLLENTNNSKTGTQESGSSRTLESTGTQIINKEGSSNSYRRILKSDQKQLLEDVAVQSRERKEYLFVIPEIDKHMEKLTEQGLESKAKPQSLAEESDLVPSSVVTPMNTQTQTVDEITIAHVNDVSENDLQQPTTSSHFYSSESAVDIKFTVTLPEESKNSNSHNPDTDEKDFFRPINEKFKRDLQLQKEKHDRELEAKRKEREKIKEEIAENEQKLESLRRF